MQVFRNPREAMSAYPLLKAKALEYPNPGAEEKAFAQKKDEFLSGPIGGVAAERKSGIYGATGAPNYEFSSNSDSPFQQQFGLLVDAFLNFAGQHQSELDMATQELKVSEYSQDYKFTAGDLKQLTNLKTKMASANNIHGLHGHGVEQTEIVSYFKKIKQQLEEILFAMTCKLEELPPGDIRTATLKSIAATLNTIARASEPGKCTEGTSTLIEEAHNKWCGKKELGGWLLNFRQKIVNDLAGEYVTRRAAEWKPILGGYETHVPANYRRVAHEQGLGTPEEALKQDPYSGEKEATLAAAHTDMLFEFPKRYNYESICECVARALTEKCQAFLAGLQDIDGPLQEAKTKELLRITAFLVDERICSKADIISEVDVNGMPREKVNPQFRQRLLGYCIEYAPTLLAAEGYIEDIGQIQYQIKDQKQTKAKQDEKSSQLPLDTILAQKLAQSEDVDTWQVNEKGDNLLTDALHRGEFFKFVALLRKSKLQVGPQMDALAAPVSRPRASFAEAKTGGGDAKEEKAPSERQLTPLARNAQGVTALAIIVGNPKQGGGAAGPRCLQSWQQRLALQVLLQQPCVTFEEIKQAFIEEKGVALRESFVKDDDFSVDSFSLFWDALAVKARHSLCLRMGREEAWKDKKRLKLIQSGELPKMELFEIAQLGEAKLKSLQPGEAEAKVAILLKDFADRLKLVELLAKQNNYKKLYHVVLNIPGLDIAGIPFAGLRSDTLQLISLLKRINTGEITTALQSFQTLAGNPGGNPRAYKNLLKIIANQCPDRQRRDFIKALAQQETDLDMRLVLVEAVPEPGIVEVSAPQMLRLMSDVKEVIEVKETPLRLVILTDAKNKPQQLQRVKTLIEHDADPFLPGNQSAFAVAISPAVADPTQQERIIKLLLASERAPSPVLLLLETSKNNSTYKAFTLLWDLAKQSMEKICQAQLGLAYTRFLLQEREEMLQQWGVCQVGPIALAQQNKWLDSIMQNPYQEAKDLHAQAPDCNLENLGKFLEWAQEAKGKRRGKFANQWSAGKFVVTVAEAVNAVAAHTMETHTHYLFAAAALGQKKVGDFIKTIPATCVAQADGQGHSVLYHLIVQAQIDKLEKLLCEIEDLDLEAVFRMPDILVAPAPGEALTPVRQNMRYLIQLIHELRQLTPDYKYAKQLFLKFTASDAGRYQRLATIISKQCAKHAKEFFQAFVEGEESIHVFWALRDYIKVDFKLLSFAVKLECSLATFEQFWEAVNTDSKAQDEADDDLAMDVAIERKQELKESAALPSVPSTTRTAEQKQIFCTALKALLESKGLTDSTQLQKLQRLLITDNLMVELQASYPAEDHPVVMTPMDAFIKLLLAIQAQQWSVSIAYYRIYIRITKQPDAAKTKLPEELITIVNKQCGTALSAQFIERVAGEESKPSQFLSAQQLFRSRYGYGYDAKELNRQLTSLLWEAKGAADIAIDQLRRDLSLLLQLVSEKFESAHYYGDIDKQLVDVLREQMELCQADSAKQEVIILCMIEKCSESAADFFSSYRLHTRSEGGLVSQLLPEATLLARLQLFLAEMRRLQIPPNVIKEFYKKLFALLIPEKCTYEQYPQLTGHFFEAVGFNEYLFVYEKNYYTREKETPLYHFMRTGNFAEVDKILNTPTTPPLDVEKGNDKGETVLMCAMDIKDEKQRNAYVERLLARGATVDVMSQQKKNVLVRATANGYSSTAILLIEHVGKVFADEPDRIISIFNFYNLWYQRYESALVEAAQSQPMQEDVILTMMQYMRIGINIYNRNLASPKKSAEFEIILNLCLRDPSQHGYSAQPPIKRLQLEACLPKDYKVAEQPKVMTRLLTIITRHLQKPSYQTLFAELLKEYLQPPRIQDRALLTVLMQGASDDFHCSVQAVQQADVELLELALTKQGAEQKSATGDGGPLWWVINNDPSAMQQSLDEKTQQAMTSLLLARHADIYSSPPGKPSIVSLALQGRCYFPIFLNLVEQDAKNEFLQPALLSESKQLAGTSDMAQQKFQVLELCLHLQSASSHFDGAVASLQNMMTIVKDSATILRIVQIVRKKLPAEKFSAFLQHYLTTDKSLAGELQQRFLDLLAECQGVSPIEAAQQAKRDDIVDAILVADQKTGAVTKQVMAQYRHRRSQSPSVLKELVAKILGQRYKDSQLPLTDLPSQDVELAQLFIAQLASDASAFFADKGQYAQRIQLLQHLKLCNRALFAGVTSLHYALQKQDAELIRALLAVEELRTYEAEWQLIKDSKSLQSYAIPVLEKMVEAAPLPSGSTAFILAAQYGDVAACQAVWQYAQTVLDAKSSFSPITLLNYKDQQGKSALYYAVEQCNYPLVVWLLSLPGIDRQAYCASTDLTVRVVAYRQEQASVGIGAAQPSHPSLIARLFATSAVLAAEADLYTVVVVSDSNTFAAKFQAFYVALGEQADAQDLLLASLKRIQQKIPAAGYAAFCHEVLARITPSAAQRQCHPQLYRELYQAAFVHHFTVGSPSAQVSAIAYFKILLEELQCQDEVLLAVLNGMSSSSVPVSMTVDAKEQKAAVPASSLSVGLCTAMLVPLFQAGRITVARALLTHTGMKFANDQQVKETVIFRLLAQISRGDFSSPWDPIIRQLIEQTHWQEHGDRVDAQNRTPLMLAVEQGLFALFQTMLGKTTLTTLLKRNLQRQSVLDVAAQSTQSAQFLPPLVRVLQGGLKSHQARIQQCQQFATSQDVERRIAELQMLQTSLQTEQQQLDNELKDMKDSHPEYKAKKAKQSRGGMRTKDVEKEIASLPAVLADHQQLKTLCQQTRELAILMLQHYQLYPQDLATIEAKQQQVSGAVAVAAPISPVALIKGLLAVLLDPTTATFKQLKDHYQHLLSFPALAEMNELVFRTALTLGEDRALPVQWVIQDVLVNKKLGVAMKKFVTLFNVLNTDREDKSLCFVISTIRANEGGADFCREILISLGMQALLTQRFALLKMLMSPLKMPGVQLSEKQQRAADSEFSQNMRVLQEHVSNGASRFSDEILASMSQDDTLSPLVPDIQRVLIEAKKDEFKQVMDKIRVCQTVPLAELKQQLEKKEGFIKGLERYCTQLQSTKKDSLDFKRNGERLTATQGQLRTLQQEVDGLRSQLATLSFLGSLFAQGRVLATDLIKIQLDALKPVNAGSGFLQGQNKKQDLRYPAAQAMDALLRAEPVVPELSSLQQHREGISQSTSLTEIHNFLEQWFNWQRSQIVATVLVQPGAVD